MRDSFWGNLWQGFKIALSVALLTVAPRLAGFTGRQQFLMTLVVLAVALLYAMQRFDAKVVTGSNLVIVIPDWEAIHAVHPIAPEPDFRRWNVAAESIIAKSTRRAHAWPTRSPNPFAVVTVACLGRGLFYFAETNTFCSSFEWHRELWLNSVSEKLRIYFESKPGWDGYRLTIAPTRYYTDAKHYVGDIDLATIPHELVDYLCSDRAYLTKSQSKAVQRAGWVEVADRDPYDPRFCVLKLKHQFFELRSYLSDSG